MEFIQHINPKEIRFLFERTSKGSHTQKIMINENICMISCVNDTLRNDAIQRFVLGMQFPTN